MDNEQFRQDNHARLTEFLQNVKDDTSDLTGSMLATMAQFLMNCRNEFNVIAHRNGGYLTREELINTQIQEMRNCIIDLTDVLNRKEITQ